MSVQNRDMSLEPPPHIRVTGVEISKQTFSTNKMLPCPKDMNNERINLKHHVKLYLKREVVGFIAYCIVYLKALHHH
jgi:hypothetical protein